MGEHPQANGSGIRRILLATRCSLQGLKAAWQNESAFRQELGLCILFVPLAFWLGQSAVQQAFLLGTLVLVLVAELINSAIEATVDRIGEERHELSGRAKDMGSAAVFLCLCLAGVSYTLLALERFGLTGV